MIKKNVFFSFTPIEGAVIALAYFQLEDMREYILHLDPIEDSHRCIRPNPIHDAPQLEQERYRHETFEEEHVEVIVALAQEIAEDPRRVTAPNLVGR